MKDYTHASSKHIESHTVTHISHKQWWAIIELASFFIAFLMAQFFFTPINMCAFQWSKYRTDIETNTINRCKDNGSIVFQNYFFPSLLYCIIGVQELCKEKKSITYHQGSQWRPFLNKQDEKVDWQWNQTSWDNELNQLL